MAETHWRVAANKHLAPLFKDGRVPTRAELRDAYPFGQRAYWPYKIWLEQVKWWKAGCPDKPQTKLAKKIGEVPKEQGVLLA